MHKSIAPLAVVGALLASAPAAQAHKLTCSKDERSHRVVAELPPVAKSIGLRLHRVSGVKCFQMRGWGNRIRYIVMRDRYVFRQDLYLVSEYRHSKNVRVTQYRTTPVRLSTVG